MSFVYVKYVHGIELWAFAYGVGFRVVHLQYKVFSGPQKMNEQQCEVPLFLCRYV